MNHDRLEALLWARIDGTIDSQELAELEAHLAEQAEPREIERQITAIANGLRELELERPPSELRGRINGAIKNATPPAGHSSVPPRIHATQPWHARWLPLAACLLIGAAIGYLVRPGTGPSIDRTELTGAMVTPAEHATSAPLEIAFDGGAVVARRSGTDAVVDVTLTREVELAVTVAGAEGPVRLTNLNSTTPSATEVSTDHGRVVLQTRGPGTVVLAVGISTLDEPLRLQVSADGAVTAARWIGSAGIEVEE